MVSGTDGQLRRQWTQPGQTLRARVDRRARDPPEVTPKISCQPVAQSCVSSNIIVIIMHCWNCRCSATTGEAETVEVARSVASHQQPEECAMSKTQAQSQ